MDDFSRITWLYPLKERYDVSSVLQFFYKEVKNQFSKSVHVHVLYAGNAIELMKMMFLFSMLVMGLFIKPFYIFLTWLAQ